MFKTSRNLISAVCLVFVTGCMGSLGSWTRTNHDAESNDVCVRPQIERGKRRPVIDGIGWVVGIPSKIILWDRRVDNHNISPETEAAVAQYVNDLALNETKIRINQYAPIDEWRRLVANDEVGWGWRYTLGALTWLDEAIFPGRIFGTDHFNPYTNTVSIFSDASSIAIKEGSRARDMRSRRFPGAYAAVNTLPIISMWHDTVATNYAFEYLHHERPDVEQEGYRLLYPAYGAHLGSDVASFTPFPNLLGAAVFAVPGHIIGRAQGRRVQAEETARAQSDAEDRFVD